MPRDKNSGIRKCNVRKLSDNKFQFERFTEKQAFHENVSDGVFADKLYEALTNEFFQLQVFTGEYIYSLKITSKGKFLQNRCRNTQKIKNDTVHNKEKNYIITSDNAPPVFHDLGIIGKDGKIINSMYDKYRQICRFVELINDVVSKDNREEYYIVDFGCGKSYLTFVVYHYMTNIMGKRVRITGLDLKSDVMNKCRILAEKYNCTGMEFLCMDIKDFKPSVRPDMVIALHACDIATDYALYNAYLWQSDYIFSVPCCQHELNTKIKSDTFSLLCDYGLIKERFSALTTDALRAKWLEFCGYNVDVVEFINEEFSPKNILLRASRTTKITFLKRSAIYERIKVFNNEFNSELTLEKLIKTQIKQTENLICIKGKASMLLKDVLYLRKINNSVPLREPEDDFANFMCVYRNNEIVYSTRINENSKERTVISNSVSEDEMQIIEKME